MQVRTIPKLRQPLLSDSPHDASMTSCCSVKLSSTGLLHTAAGILCPSPCVTFANFASSSPSTPSSSVCGVFWSLFLALYLPYKTRIDGRVIRYIHKQVQQAKPSLLSELRLLASRLVLDVRIASVKHGSMMIVQKPANSPNGRLSLAT